MADSLTMTNPCSASLTGEPNRTCSFVGVISPCWWWILKTDQMEEGTMSQELFFGSLGGWGPVVGITDTLYYYYYLFNYYYLNCYLWAVQPIWSSSFFAGYFGLNYLLLHYQFFFSSFTFPFSFFFFLFFLLIPLSSSPSPSCPNSSSSPLTSPSSLSPPFTPSSSFSSSWLSNSSSSSPSSSSVCSP